MAKMIMKKQSNRRMSMKGGRDWKICRRFLWGERELVGGGSGDEAPAGISPREAWNGTHSSRVSQGFR